MCPLCEDRFKRFSEDVQDNLNGLTFIQDFGTNLNFPNVGDQIVVRLYKCETCLTPWSYTSQSNDDEYFSSLLRLRTLTS